MVINQMLDSVIPQVFKYYSNIYLSNENWDLTNSWLCRVNTKNHQ